MTLWGVIPPTAVPTVATRKKSSSSRETVLGTPSSPGGALGPWAVWGGAKHFLLSPNLSPHRFPLLSCPTAAPHHNPSS